ncbi:MULTISPECIES: radical SAM protein [Pseudothermotoga]|jgi:hypothetical protein|nr:MULTISPECIES: radical SAM protein [Pseudothermotoga]KUK21907.1 MAG: Uncharacterized protein XD56_0153 [Pseudothermotoga lettingae]MDI3493916.1 lipoyl synthase [Pseudothermotoga sp.]MDK2884558.1 lipoyl synthase [Pseudothermotoga sp.]GLI49813.1 radical SAM protein [Pseudothermotoga lettingae TMO]
MINLGDAMILVDPQFTVPVSVTGEWCALNCLHCGKHYLRSMKQIGEMENYAKMGYRSFLITGGLNLKGEIPYNGVLKKLKQIKERYGLVYNFHIGFPEINLSFLKDIADVVSFDFFADKRLMKKIYGLQRDIDLQIETAMSSGVTCVPHLTVGIDCGKISHEFEALEVLAKYFQSIVLNIFVPTRGTAFELCNPPSIEDAKNVFFHARKFFKKIALGCMQPRGNYRLLLQNELSEVVDVIVKPVKKSSNYFRGCCAFALKSEF